MELGLPEDLGSIIKHWRVSSWWYGTTYLPGMYPRMGSFLTPKSETVMSFLLTTDAIPRLAILRRKIPDNRPANDDIFSFMER